MSQHFRQLDWSFEEGKIPCQIMGSGTPLVLLHGFGGKPADWSKMAQVFSESYTVIIPNLQSIYLGQKDYSFEEQVQLLSRLFGGLYGEFGPLHIAGISYGGSIAASLRVACPELFLSFVLVNPMPPNPARRTATSHLGWILRFARNPVLLSLYLGSPFGKRSLVTLARNIRPDLRDRFRRFQLFLSRRQKLVFHIVSRFSKIIMNVNWRGWEQSMTADGPDVLLIYSRNDQLFGKKSSDWWRENLLNLECFELHSGQHMAITTHPMEIKEVIFEFLNSELTQRKSS